MLDASVLTKEICKKLAEDLKMDLGNELSYTEKFIRIIVEATVKHIVENAQVEVPSGSSAGIYKVR
jgi:hypothetical protein